MVAQESSPIFGQSAAHGLGANSDAQERQSLISHDGDTSCISSSGNRPHKSASFGIQLAALCWVRLIDPVAYSQAFPYVNELVASLHIADDPSQVGFYSGILESTFAVSQLFSLYHFARASDVVGRRPVMLVGLAGIGVSTLLFGLSRSFLGLMTTRFIAGMFAGNSPVLQSVFGEMTNPSNEAMAISFYGLTWPFGSIIGPLIGGTLSNPAKQFPKLFDFHFFRVYPYFLPCFLTFVISVLGFTACYAVLEETLPSKRRDTAKSDRHSYGAVETGDSSRDDRQQQQQQKPLLTFFDILSVPILRSLCISAFLLNFVNTSFDVVFVLFCYTPITSGGLGFSTLSIGYAMAVSGILGLIFVLFVLRALLARFARGPLFCACMHAWPFAFASLPFLNLVARSGAPPVFLWAGIIGVLALTRVGNVPYALSIMLSKAHAPEGNLGLTNGIMMCAMCVARGVAPTFVSTMFVLSVEKGLLGGHFWAVVMMSISLAGSPIYWHVSRVPPRVRM